MATLRDYIDTDIKELFEKQNVNLGSINIDVRKPEVDVKKLAELLGCTLEYQILFSKAGSHSQEDKKIVVNSLDPEYRQRFTIAHEIGHNVYGHPGVRNRVTKEQKLDSSERDYIEELMERQANNFASRLLMPESLLKDVEHELRNNGEINNPRQRIMKLAEVFNVSYISMEYRLSTIDFE